jgi:DNA-binding Xre family transcriptional regulator
VNNALGYTMSTATLAKLGKGRSVTTDTLITICNLLDVDLNDIVDTEVITK